MLHVIYIYLIINSFLTGYMYEDNLRSYVLWKLILVIIVGILLFIPAFLLASAAYYVGLWYKHSWLANIIYVYRFKRGTRELPDEEGLKVINESAERRKLKKWKTITDRVFI